MSELADPVTNPRPPASDRDRAVDVPVVLHDLCPLLIAHDGSWRSARPSRFHRCAALGPDVPLLEEKQRRLCLGEAHRTCATYAAAIATTFAAEARTASATSRTGRPYPRTAPVVLEHGRAFSPLLPGGERHAPQLILAVLMAVAFGAVVIARLSGVGGERTLMAGAASSTPSASAAPSTPAPSTAPPSPKPEPTVSATPAPATPSPAASVRTYRVRPGDTLSAIAGRFGTTVRELVRLNDIEDPSRIRIGLVLKLP
jgi:hypothetical protein